MKKHLIVLQRKINKQFEGRKVSSVIFNSNDVLQSFIGEAPDFKVVMTDDFIKEYHITCPYYIMESKANKANIFLYYINATKEFSHCLVQPWEDDGDTSKADFNDQYLRARELEMNVTKLMEDALDANISDEFTEPLDKCIEMLRAYQDKMSECSSNCE